MDYVDYRKILEEQLVELQALQKTILFDKKVWNPSIDFVRKKIELSREIRRLTLLLEKTL